MLFKSELRILLLNSGDPQSSLARFLNSDLQRSPKFTRAIFSGINLRKKKLFRAILIAYDTIIARIQGFVGHHV